MFEEGSALIYCTCSSVPKGCTCKQILYSKTYKELRLNLHKINSNIIHTWDLYCNSWSMMCKLAIAYVHLSYTTLTAVLP